MLDFAETNWLSLTLFVAAVVLAARKRWWLAVSLVLLGGGAFLPKTAIFDIGETTVRLPGFLAALAAMGFALTVLVLVFARAWSFRFAVFLCGIALLGIGGLATRATGDGIVEVVRAIRHLEFVRPEWLALLLFVPVVVLMSRKSLSGLGPVRKWVAVGARAAGIALLAMALAEPRVKRTSENVTVLFVVDRSFSVPQDLDPNKPVADAVDRRWEATRGFIQDSVAKRGIAHRHDQVGLILFGRRPRLALPPAAVLTMPVDERMAGPIDGNYTDIAAALKLAIASFPEGSSKRIVLVSDGNENIGAAEEQANIAKKNGIPIDVIALAPGFRNESEVLVQAVDAPQGATQGARLPIRVLIRNANPSRIVDGRLELLKVGIGDDTVVEIEESPQVLDKSKPPPLVRLLPGLNVFRFRDRADPLGDSAFSYRATFTPVRSAKVDGSDVVAGLPGDRPANNRATAAVVSRGQRRVLFLDDTIGRGSPHQHLIDSLRKAKIRVDRLPADKLPPDKGDLGVFLSNFDCIVIANVPAERFSGDQMETLRTTVYDQGCGLVMVGGPDSYGPGGYQGTAVEAALPVDCEIKAMKAAGKGGLVLIMHASEMADGNKWQKEIAKLAIQRLGPNDMVGVTDYGMFGAGAGVNWQIPFQDIGDDKARLLAKIDKMSPGDMPDFDPFLKAAADTLSDAQHGLSVRHCILISDGDPQFAAAGKAAVAKMAANGVTCTTVGVATHGGAEKTRMKEIAEGTKDGSGRVGNFYDVTNPAQLPAIYIKESRRVSQMFIYDKVFEPQLKLRGGPSEGLPNVLPRLHGFVRTTKKENPLVEMQIEGPQVFDQKFPVLASWRYGLGKAIAFTADARTQPGSPELFWDRDWVGSDVYQKFWEQSINWAMREAERGKLTLITEYRDGRIRVTADVRDEKDKPIGGMSLEGRVTLPRPPGPGEKPPVVEFKPKGAGMYEAEFAAEEAGSYFLNVQAQRAQVGPDGKLMRDKNGNPVMEVYDASRAGITVPYSPEFADLESNTPLLRRLADISGGTFHTEDPTELKELIKTADNFRAAPEAVRALLPFWFWLVFAAALLLVFDVATRRISLERAELATFARRTWAALRATPDEEGETASLGRLLQRKQAVADTIDRKRAARRFTPTGETSDAAPAGADEFAARMPGSPPTGIGPTPPPTAQPLDDGDDPFERLRKAKERAKRQRPDRE